MRTCFSLGRTRFGFGSSSLLPNMRSARTFSLLLFLLASGFTSTTLFAQTNWNWSNPRPQGNDLLGVTIRQDSLEIAVGSWGTIERRVNGSFQAPSFTGTRRLAAAAHYIDTVWVVGDSSTIYRSLDDGLSWSNESPTSYWIKLHGIAESNRIHLVAVGDSGYIYGTSNSGDTWTKQTNTNHARLNAVKLTNTTAWAAGNAGALIRGASYGNFGWVSATTGVLYNLNGLSMDTNTIFVAGDSGHVMRFNPISDSVVTDTILGSNNLYDVFYSAPYVVAVGAGGTIYASTDLGTTWSAPTSGTTFDLLRIDSSADHLGHLLAVGQSGVILQSTNYGQSWTRLDSGSRLIIYALGESPSGKYFGTSNAGGLYSSGNSGLSWRRDTISTTFNQLPDIQFVSKGFGLIATNGAGVLVTTDSGSTWQSKTLTGSQILGVGATNDSIGLAVGALGVIWRSTNRGATWTSVVSGTHNALYDVDCYGSKAIAVGYNGTFIYSSDAGASWSTGSGSSTAQFNRVRFSTVTNAVAVGVVGNVWHTTNSGASWSSGSSGVTVTLRDIAWHDNINGMIVGDGGLILKTSNGGTSWTADLSRTGVALYGALIPSGTTAFVAGDNGVVLSTSNSLLPVELVSFDGIRVSQDQVELRWHVAEQSQNAGFRIERLASDWQTIGTVPVATADGGDAIFNFVDQNATSNASTYRLLQTDLNGSIHVLGQVTVAAWSTLATSDRVAVWPNPASGSAQIAYTNSAIQDVRVTLYDVLGHAIQTNFIPMQSAGQHTITLGTSSLAPGMYHASLTQGSNHTVVSIAIVR